MQRRAFAEKMGVAALGMSLMGGSVAMASASHHDAKKMTKSGLDQSKLKRIQETAGSCMTRSRECVVHCNTLLAHGDKTLADCQLAAMNTEAVCQALGKIVAVDSLNGDTMKKYLAACHDICKNCADECAKHKGHHRVCKACFDACQECMKACKALL